MIHKNTFLAPYPFLTVMKGKEELCSPDWENGE